MQCNRIPSFIGATIYAELAGREDTSLEVFPDPFLEAGPKGREVIAGSSDVLLATKWAFRWGKQANPSCPIPSFPFLKCVLFSVNFSPPLRCEFFVTSLPHLLSGFPGQRARGLLRIKIS